MIDGTQIFTALPSTDQEQLIAKLTEKVFANGAKIIEQVAPRPPAATSCKGAMIRSARRALPAGAGRREQHVLHHQVGSSEGEAGEGDAARAGGARPRAVFRRARAPQGRAGKPRTSDRANGLPRARPPPLRRTTSAHSSRRPARAQASASIVVSSELVAYCCDRETFTTFFGSVQALIDKEVERRERQVRERV